MSFRQKFPDDASLVAHVDSQLLTIVDQVRQTAGPLEAAYVASRKASERNSAYILCGVLMLSIFLIEEVRQLQGTVTWILLIAVGILGFIFIIRGARGFRQKRIRKDGLTPTMQFIEAAHQTIFKQAMQLLGIYEVAHIEVTSPTRPDRKMFPTTLGRYIGALPTPENASALALLDHSELVTEERNTVVIDDMFNFMSQGASVFVAELDIKHVTRSGKNQHTKHIFTGLFVCLDLKRACTGKTFVSTDDDRTGIGHQSFWSRHIGGPVQETKLEWNEFEDLLHVATSDPVEARYILTPDVMHALYEWWNAQKSNMRISFIGSRMYILCPSQDMQFYKTIEAVTDAEVRKHVLAFVRPLLPVLHLVEIVQEQKL